MILSGVGPQSGASAIVGGASLPSSPTFRQVFMTSGGLYVCLTDGNWTLLEAGTTTGEVTGNGVTNRLTKWIDGSGSVLGDSGVADDGTNILALRPFGTGFGLSTPGQFPTGARIAAATTTATTPRGIHSLQFTTDAVGAQVGLQKARGTVGTPVIIVTGDALGQVLFRGYDGTAYLSMGSISCASTGTIGTNRVPTTLTFSTATDAATSVLTTALTINESQTGIFAKLVTVGVGSTSSALTDLLINPTTKASGNLIDAQVNSVSKFSVNFAGTGTVAGALNVTGAITGSSTVQGTILFVNGTGAGTPSFRNTGAQMLCTLGDNSLFANFRAADIQGAAVLATGLLTNTGITTDAAHTDTSVCQDTTSHTFYFGSGAAGICLGSSAGRFKEGWEYLASSVMDQIMSLKVGTFRYKEGYGDNGGRTQIGVLAEDIAETMPEMAVADKEGRPSQVDYMGILLKLIPAFQEQQYMIQVLNERLNTLLA